MIVAQMVGVDRRSVRRWEQAYLRRGRTGILARPSSGRPPKLTPRQRQTLARWILRGPQAFGYPTAL
jgi:transposase